MSMTTAYNWPIYMLFSLIQIFRFISIKPKKDIEGKERNAILFCCWLFYSIHMIMLTCKALIALKYYFKCWFIFDLNPYIIYCLRLWRKYSWFKLHFSYWAYILLGYLNLIVVQYSEINLQQRNKFMGFYLWALLLREKEHNFLGDESMKTAGMTDN